MKLSEMVGYISGYLTKIEQVVGGALSPIVFEEITLAADANKQYTVTTLYPKHALYDLRSCRVTALVKDVDGGSTTNGMFVNSETVVNTAIDATGKVIIENFSIATITVLVRVDPPAKLKV